MLGNDFALVGCLYLTNKFCSSFVFFEYRYEGEWLQNNMEGHGVVEVEIPGIEPVPGSKYVTQF